MDPFLPPASLEGTEGTEKRKQGRDQPQWPLYPLGSVATGWLKKGFIYKAGLQVASQWLTGTPNWVSLQELKKMNDSSTKISVPKQWSSLSQPWGNGRNSRAFQLQALLINTFKKTASHFTIDLENSTLDCIALILIQYIGHNNSPSMIFSFFSCGSCVSWFPNQIHFKVCLTLQANNLWMCRQKLRTRKQENDG